MHERLRVDVLVVLGEVEAAFQRFIDHASVIASRKAEFWLNCRAEQRPAKLVEPLALDHDAGRGPLERLHVSDREPHVLEFSAFSGLKPNTLPMIEAERLAIEPGSKRSRS